jgi:hypothetical protein
MAKSTNSSDRKVTFGERRKGKAKKSRGPKEKAVKKYKGQG